MLSKTGKNLNSFFIYILLHSSIYSVIYFYYRTKSAVKFKKNKNYYLFIEAFVTLKRIWSMMTIVVYFAKTKVKKLPLIQLNRELMR